MTYFDLGPYSRKITTSSPDAQIWFDRGLNWLFGFNHAEAIKCFQKALAHDGASNPSAKSVVHGAMTWFANYGANPLLWLAPLLAVAGAALAWLMRARRMLAFLCSGFASAAVIATAVNSAAPSRLMSS